MKTTESEKLFQRAKQLMPGGVSSPVRAFNSVGGTPLFIKRGEGAYIYDEDDNRYIDFCMSWGALIHGHADYDVVRAIEKIAEKGTSFGMPHRSEIELAELVTKRYKSIDKVRFVNSGTEATMSAIRLARAFTGRNKFIKCEGCYHGHADHLLVSSGSGLATLGTPNSAGVTEDNIKNTLIVPYNDLSSLEETLKLECDNVAALILEPVACNYGLLLPDKNYLKGVRELCSEYGALLIFDEVINGLRLAPGGAEEYYGVEADITTLGKVLGGGLPVGAYGASQKIMQYVAPEGDVYQAGTLAGNPLAMSAGVATLRKLDESGGYSDLKSKADYFADLMKSTQKEYQGKMLFTQLESIFSITFTDKESLACSNDVESSDMELFAVFHRKLLERGVYFAPSGYEVSFISTAHTEDILEKSALVIQEVLAEIF